MTTLPAICPCCGQDIAGPGRINIGVRVRIAREARGWNQSRLGTTMSRPRTHAAISELETGKTRIHVEDIEEIAWLLGVDTAWLLTGKVTHEPPARHPRRRTRRRAMTDHERLQQMARTVQADIEAAGIDPALVRYDVLHDARPSFEVGYWPRGLGIAQWSIRVAAPYDSTLNGDPMPHQPAELRVDGQITPLSLRIVTALDGLMWSDRTE